MKATKFMSVLITVVTLTLVGCRTSDESSSAAGAKPYPLQTCIVSDEALGEDPHVFVYEGQQLKTCCADCQKEFAKSPEKFLSKLK